jgi:hypothetical protein
VRRSDRELSRAFTDLARATTAASVVTDRPATSTVRGVVVSTSPLRARVGIAGAWTSVTNSVVGYTPAIGHVVEITRRGHRQFITGKT